MVAAALAWSSGLGVSWVLSSAALHLFWSFRLNRMRSDHDISLVLLDLWMPVMDGWEFLRRKKGDPDLANVPVVVISAIPPVDLDGVESVLTKPIDVNQLMETVSFV